MRLWDYLRISGAMSPIALEILSGGSAIANHKSIVDIWQKPYANYSGIDSIQAEGIKDMQRCAGLDSARVLEDFIRKYSFISWETFRDLPRNEKEQAIALTSEDFCNTNPHCQPCRSYERDLLMFSQLGLPDSLLLKLEGAYRFLDSLEADGIKSYKEKADLAKQHFQPIFYQITQYLAKKGNQTSPSDTTHIFPQPESKPDTSGSSSIENYFRSTRGEKLATTYLHREAYVRRS